MKLTNKRTVLDGWKEPKLGRAKPTKTGRPRPVGRPGTLRRGAQKLLRPGPPSKAVTVVKSTVGATKRGAVKMWEKDEPGIIRQKIISGLVKLERTIGGVNVS